MLPGRATAKKPRDCSQTGNRAGAAPEPTAAVQLHKRRRKSTATFVSTAYEANVIEVLKAHPRLLGAGASQPLSGPGGSIQRADGSTDTTVGNLMVRLPIGTEWVLFLSWSDHVNGFHVDNGRVGAFQIVGERMRPAGDDAWASYWHGRSVESFMDAMRQFVTQHRDEPQRGC